MSSQTPPPWSKVQQPPTPTKLFSGSLIRTRRKRLTAFTDSLPEPAEEVSLRKRPARAALLLALAHRWEDEITEGVYRDRADIARKFGLTRARVTQILDLMLLAPIIQKTIIHLESCGKHEVLTERHMRQIARLVDWRRQVTLWASILERLAAEASR